MIIVVMMIMILYHLSSSSVRDAGAVIHTHSKNAVMATLAFRGTEFRVTHLEMIKVRSQMNEKELQPFLQRLNFMLIRERERERENVWM